MPHQENTARIASFFATVSYNASPIALLAGMPEITVTGSTLDAADFASGAAGALLLLRLDAKIVIRTKDIALALELAANAATAPGNDLAAATALHPLVLAPPSGNPAKTLTFPAAGVLPNLEYRPELDQEHTARLTFFARPLNGVLYSYV